MTDYSQVDTLDPRYTLVNFGAERDLGGCVEGEWLQRECLEEVRHFLPHHGRLVLQTLVVRRIIDSGLVGRTVRSHEERRCSNLGPTQSRISQSIVWYANAGKGGGRAVVLKRGG